MGPLRFGCGLICVVGVCACQPLPNGGLAEDGLGDDDDGGTGDDWAADDLPREPSACEALPAEVVACSVPPQACTTCGVQLATVLDSGGPACEPTCELSCPLPSPCETVRCAFAEAEEDGTIACTTLDTSMEPPIADRLACVYAALDDRAPFTFQMSLFVPDSLQSLPDVVERRIQFEGDGIFVLQSFRWTAQDTTFPCLQYNDMRDAEMRAVRVSDDAWQSCATEESPEARLNCLWRALDSGSCVPFSSIECPA